MTKRSPSHATHSNWPHRLALLLVCVTFPLIWVGGLVTTYDAGMAVPDWPSTYGYNLFLYPWTTWVFGPFDLFIEHGHRLLGALAGLIAIALVCCAWIQESRLWARYLCLGAFVLVCVQGILGGARVLLDQRLLAMIHACVGPVFFAYCAALAAVTSRTWHEACKVKETTDARFLRLSLLTAGLVYLQLVLGARVRHVAPDASPNGFMVAVLFHVGVAFVVLGHGLAMLLRTWRSNLPAAVCRPAQVMACLTLLQVLLGASVWLLKYGWPFGLNERYRFAAITIVEGSMLQAMTTTAHVAFGSLILAFSVVTAVRGYRFFREAGSERSPLVRTAWQWEAIS